MDFQIKAPFEPAGDQPQAIEKLAAGVEQGKVYPHNLRSLFARSFYSACHDVVRLADVLGHSSIETTRIYLLSTGKEYIRQLGKLGLVQ